MHCSTEVNIAKNNQVLHDYDRAKKLAKKCTKKCAARAKLLFLLIRHIVF